MASLIKNNQKTLIRQNDTIGIQSKIISLINQRNRTQKRDQQKRSIKVQLKKLQTIGLKSLHLCLNSLSRKLWARNLQRY